MNFTIEKAKATWTNSDHSLCAQLPDAVKVGEMPSFPLAHSVKMPDGIGFPIGSLALRLNDLQVTSEGGFSSTLESVSIKSRHVYVCLCFTGARMTGTHTLEAKQMWDAGIDGAGTGLSFDENGRVRHPGGADTNKNPAWVQTAKEQRQNLLNNGGNGMTLMNSYADHRVALNDAFTDPMNYAFQRQWGVPSITAMSGHTNDCMSETSKNINGNKKYDNQMTYNENALTQQLALGTVLVGMGGSKSDGTPDPSCPYQQAAKAVVNFNASVLSNTKAKKTKDIPAQTNKSVYKTVADGKPATEVSLEQTHRYLNGEDIGGKSADGSSWSMMLDEEDRRFLRDFKAEHQLHQERLVAAKPIVLFGGAASADLKEFYMYLEFSIPENGLLTFSNGRVELDSFDLELDDSKWSQDLGNIAGKELSKARFIKSLLHDRVADALERELIDKVASILVNALDD